VFAVSDALLATLGIAGVFFVVFPLIVHGMLAFAAAQIMGERRANLEYEREHPSF
jgi:Sec-independent protein secretion pathway component TatC